MNAPSLALLIGALAVAAQAKGPPQPELRLGSPNSLIVPSGLVMTQSPNGQRLAVTTYDGVVNVVDVVDARAPRVTRTFDAGDTSYSGQFLTDRTLVTGGKGGRIALWDTETGAPIRVLREGGDDISELAISPDGARIAFSAYLSSITVIIDATNGRPVADLPGGGVRHFAFSPDSRRLVSASDAENLTAWDLDKSTVAWSSNIGKGMRNGVTKIVFSPDGRSIAVNYLGNRVLIIDADSGETIRALDAGKTEIESLAFMPDGRSLIVGYASGILRKIDVADGKEIFSIHGAGRIDGISVDHDGAWIRTLEHDGYLVIRNAETGRCAREGMDRFLWAAVYTRDGKLLAAGASDGTIELYEMPDGKFLRRIDTGGRGVFGLTFSPDERMLAASDLRTVRAWDPRIGEKLLEIDGKWSYLPGFSFSASGRSLFIAEDDHSIGEWDVHGGSRLRQFAVVDDSIKKLTVSQDGRYVAAGGWGGRAHLWDRETGKEIFRRPDSTGSYKNMDMVAFAANGRQLVGIDKYARSLYRFSVPDGKILEKRSLGYVWGTRVIPGGIMIVASEGRKPGWTVTAIRDDGRLKTLLKHPGEKGVEAVSPDGRRWVTMGDNGVLEVWRAP